MMKSMTAFGRAKINAYGRDVTAEIKSVNSRFLDLTAKLPRNMSFLEDRIKPYLQSKGLSRGKVEVYIGIDVTGSENYSVAADEGVAEAYVKALTALRDRFELRDDISVMGIARLPDVLTVTKPEEDIEKDWEDVRTALDGAFQMFTEARAREGANIERDLASKIEGIGETVARIETLSLNNISGYRARLEERLRKVLSENGVSADESRILTECAIFADKIAIDEELVRLRSHFDAFADITESSEPVGRKLDFLMQEMNREINTIGSKSSDAEIAHLVVDVKTELEKIREQIQNIE